MNFRRSVNGLPTKRVFGVLFLIVSYLVIAGCSANGTAGDAAASEPVEEIDRSAEAIRTVIEKEFNGPDEKYKELWEAAMATQKSDMTQEEYDATLETPEYTAYTGYMEDTYADYFTDNGYDRFIRATPAFFYSGFDHNYKLSTSDIEINQHEKEPTFYQFTFQVMYEDENGKVTSYDFEGEAIAPEEGKIGKLQFVDKDELLQDMNGIEAD